MDIFEEKFPFENNVFLDNRYNSILIIGSCFVFANQKADELIDSVSQDDFQNFFETYDYTQLEDSLADTFPDWCMKLFIIYLLEQVFNRTMNGRNCPDNLSVTLSLKYIFVTSIFTKFSVSS